MAPHDLDTTASTPPASANSSSTSITSPTPRKFNPLILFASGASFFLLSTFITRRQLIRRYRTTTPSFYKPSNASSTNSPNGATEAFEALSLATINVTSAAMMAIGGGLWMYDIESMADLRRKVRRGIGVEDRDDQEADEEMEEWLATVISRKETKERKREGAKKGLVIKEEDEEMVGRILKALEEQGGGRKGR